MVKWMDNKHYLHWNQKKNYVYCMLLSLYHHSYWQPHQTIVIVLPEQASLSNRFPSMHDVHVVADVLQVPQGDVHATQALPSSQNPSIHASHVAAAPAHSLQSATSQAEIQE